jgi:membrane protein DedA with SNARE-associated domain
MPKRLGMLANVAAAGLLALALATVSDTDTPQSLLSLAVGAVLAPWLCLWVGRVLGRGALAEPGAKTSFDNFRRPCLWR